MKRYWFSFSLVIWLQATLFAQTGTFQIEFSLKAAGGGDKFFLRYFTENGPYMDSAMFTNGLAIMRGKVPRNPKIARIWILKSGETHPKNDNTGEVWLEAEPIRISSTASLANAKYTGSPIQEQFGELQKDLWPHKIKSHALDETYEKAEVEKDMVKKYKLINDEYPSLFREKQKILGSFITKYPSSVLSAYKFDDFAGDGRMDLSVVEPVYDRLDKDLRKHPLVTKVADRIAINKRTAPGMEAIEFSQADTSGNQVRLSIFKGKYLLIDFWAGWCIPCRAENPQLRKLYDQYKTKGFEILGVSLDGERKRWTNAIITDRLGWTQVSDLNIFDNKVAKTYGITSIPQNVLIGPNGKIIDWNLRGSVLDEKLKTIFR